jgi:hypothetical protein
MRVVPRIWLIRRTIRPTELLLRQERTVDVGSALTLMPLRYAVTRMTARLTLLTPLKRAALRLVSEQG